ncbi:cryptochrome/photolyase family protein [Pseudohongiella spirulinae]|uniref:Deoxyribodipyrimidine photo-lyase n=1 Tax=Pseudohongiella spirulinae TaxID=1249552 RepID=A0A0S2KB12_9GAMM|nr:cryptochrome/photolyase family protein [Pseudohongiella spirulinae]ALO45268.1 Deoxyribodipyrimidine photo-lyase [Pseudohongiella spirulinae]
MKVGLILGDQLSHNLPTLQKLDRECDMIVMAEVAEEATYVKHHKQKIALLFSAMRHFARELQQQGWQLRYHSYQPQSTAWSLLDVLSAFLRQSETTELVITECGEYRLQSQITEAWPTALQCRVTVLPDSRFITSKDEFSHWARGRKQLRMEYFYREVRRKTGLLMDGNNPLGGQWNFDADNRQAYKGRPALPERLIFQRDAIDIEVLSLVEEHFATHPGELSGFIWPTSREQALTALDCFICQLLPHFGQFQDAMNQHQHFMFHSLLSTSLNCGLLDPIEVCRAAERAYLDGAVPLNAAEGFIRQIIGWREYVRGLYWLLMPTYKNHNYLQQSTPLPHYYWTGKTDMLCMQQSLHNTLNNAYAHHIQRLMLTGNFALLAGLDPQQVCDWYLAIYADAYEWVELPNTLGMALYADGGVMASKPYAASGSYINRMSDYCRSCRYKVKTSTETDSCPFNSLYWHFINRHQAKLEHNPRMGMVYRNWKRMDAGKKQAILTRADIVIKNIEML